MKFTKEYLELAAPEAMRADGYDDCIVGIGHRCGSTAVLVYDIDMVIAKIMKRDKCDYEDALDFFEYNIGGAYVGEGTHLFMNSTCEL